jgi:hypothetical protein
MGIPHLITRDRRKALEASLLLVSFSEEPSPPTDLVESLTRYVIGGGNLVSLEPAHSNLGDLFGYAQTIPSRSRREIRWTDRPHPLTRYLNTPEEKVCRLRMEGSGDVFMTTGYTTVDDTEVLAVFDDGPAAVTLRRAGAGRAMAIGGDLVNLVLRSYSHMHYGIHKDGTNAFQTSTDSYLLFIRAAYEHLVPGGFTISTIPPHHSGALILTHDLDTGIAFRHLPAFAEVEERAGVRSTIFAQTKYIKDFYDVAFFDDSSLEILACLAERGFEIGSHSVCHTPVFNRIPPGEPLTDSLLYRPCILDRETTEGATVRGEVMVSKALLQPASPGEVSSFRSGHLLFNRHLVRALEEAGYIYDSSMATYDCGCNFPFRLFAGGGFTSPSEILEIPVTLGDSKVGNLTRHLDWFRRVLAENTANGAPTTLLIHPTRTDDKLETLRGLLAGLPAAMWVGPLSDFAAFWNSRYRLDIQARPGPHGPALMFTATGHTRPLALIPNRPSSTTIVLPPLAPGDTIPGSELKLSR